MATYSIRVDLEQFLSELFKDQLKDVWLERAEVVGTERYGINVRFGGPELATIRFPLNRQNQPVSITMKRDGS
jgi:hypothetical protein